jgi:hypothetical protein
LLGGTRLESGELPAESVRFSDETAAWAGEQWTGKTITVPQEGAPGQTCEVPAPPITLTRYTSYNNRWSDHVIELEKGLLRFSLKDDAPLYSKTKLNDGNWHHVITSVGPGGQRLYADGAHLATGKLPRRAHTSNRLGLDLGPGDSEGTVTLDEVRVTNGAANAGK